MGDDKAFESLLDEFQQSKVPVIINDSDKAGRILNVHKDYIDFQRIWKESKTGTGKDKKTEKVMKKETKNILIKDIFSVSDGEKEIPKTEKEEELATDLGGL